ncbi:LysM peptidoglycan-binding domain-containing M23 family metallopeptidase [Novosphingopyxis sp. YJ-S2-01]|uniref:LysM peptidoglycan-binding domain-containing M23 family metallopeptidase n=1 Tax=Novosphingopyxis sp. YJ-S2-01 TaxID=2794021 RepID=UPI001E28C4FB|nr:LysM peptidoglycan-binding domain-containing M23 family metallopeptidase [Novosphingopyxis sp. YJ-S2-01]
MGAGVAAAMLSACIPSVQAPARRAAAPPASTPFKPGPLLETNDGALVAPPRPTWDGGQVVKRDSAVKPGEYVVRAGDTLRGIGNRTGAGSEAIAAANNLPPPFTIYPGQRLIIPGGRYHSVAAGETGIAIAQAYGVRWADMVALNGLEEPYILRIGQKLQVPDSATAMQPIRTAAAPIPSGAPAAVTSDQASALERRAAAFSIGIDDIVTGSQPALAEGRRATAAVAKPQQAVATAIAQPAVFNGRFAWPVRGRLLSSFGSNKDGRINDGINIAAKAGTPVLSAGSGVVAYSGDEIGVFGGLVLIDHGGGWITAYGHLGRLDVVRGEKVGAGQPIGTVGQTGYVSEPQLHFEIRQKRKPIDPASKLPSS